MPFADPERQRAYRRAYRLEKRDRIREQARAHREMIAILTIKNAVAMIPLSRGLFALIDVADIPLVNAFRWHATVPSPAGKVYAATNRIHRLGRGQILMHRLIAGQPKKLIDHRNTNGLDNRRKNLRPCTASQNAWNKENFAHSTAYKGVTFHAGASKFMSQIRVGDKNRYLGLFVDPIDAARAYDRAATRAYGEFARTNFGESNAVG